MKINELERSELEKFIAYYDFSKEFKNKTFLITGSKGIVGQGVIKWLLLLNEKFNLNIKIYASTRNPNAVPNYITKEDNIAFCEFGEEEKAIKEDNIDFLIHAAAPTENSFNLVHPYEASRIILDETEKMIDLCLKKDNCSMVFISSEEIYGITHGDNPIKEDYFGAINSLNLRSVYPLNKKAAELLCFSAASEYKANIRIVRPTVIQGLFQRYDFNKIESEILRCVVEKKNLVLKSAGLTKKCMVYSLDVISAIFIVLCKGQAGETYNISNPDNFITVRDLGEYIFKAFNPSLKVEYPKEDTSISCGFLPQRSFVPDISKIKNLGWNPLYKILDIYKIDCNRFIR